MDSSILSLLIVAIIGYCLINKENGKMLTWADVGKILLLFAIVEGLMYFVAPLPVRLVCNKQADPFGGLFSGGDASFHDSHLNVSSEAIHNDQLQMLTGGGSANIRAGSVLDNVY